MITHDVIKRPVVTEKSTQLKDTRNAYVFEVDLLADKPAIKQAVEQMFGVKVAGVRVSIVPGRFKRAGRGRVRTMRWKKAVVSLSQGKIELFEGV